MTTICKPKKIGNTTIKNAIVFPPVFCFEYKTKDYLFTKEHINHYIKRAKGGAGLIIVEATAVADDARLADAGVGLYEDKQIDGFCNLKKACEKYGTKVIVQLNFAGLTSRSENGTHYSPSEETGRFDDFVPMTKVDIERVKQAFVSAAVRAKKAGLDGIEIHAAHGYLLSRFLDPNTNRRTDEYGGTAQNRARIVTDIIETVRCEIGDDFIISCRMGSDIPDFDGAVEIAQLIEKAGADALHISTGTGMPKGEVPDDFPCNIIVYNGTQIKNHVNIPVIVVNKITTSDQCNYLADNDMADFVACGRAMLSDEDFANAVLDGSKDYIKCSECKKCFWFSGKPEKCPGQIKKRALKIREK